jgi:hypothetical protein
MDAGRLLEVSVDPPRWYAIWSFVPHEAGLPLLRAESEQSSTVAPARSRFVVMAGPGQAEPWVGWLSEPEPESTQGPHGLPLLTTGPAIAERFRPGQVFGRHSRRDEDFFPPHPVGTLVAAVAQPEWLVRRLITTSRLLPMPIDPDAFRPWEAVIERVRVSPDGLRLVLHLNCDRGEIPASVEAFETADRVNVRVRVGINPRKPPPPPPAIARAAEARPGRIRTGYHAGVEVPWRVGVVLTEPLADRPVYDIAARHDDGRWEARRAWRTDH